MLFTDIKTHASALGVAVMTGLIFYVFMAYDKNPDKTKSDKTEQNIVSPSGAVKKNKIVPLNLITLTPAEIINKLKAISEPAQREKAVQGYLGKGVEWNLYLEKTIKQDQDFVQVTLLDTQDLSHHIRIDCVVFLNRNNILKSIENKMQLTVSGQISQIAPNNDSIQLDNAILKALPNN